MMITFTNTFNPTLDTVAAMLTKRFGRGVRLPLEPFLCGHEKRHPLHMVNNAGVEQDTLDTSVDFSVSPPPPPGSHMTRTPSSGAVSSSRLLNRPVHILSHLEQLLTVSGQLIQWTPTGDVSSEKQLPGASIDHPSQYSMSTARLQRGRRNSRRVSRCPRRSQTLGPRHVTDSHRNSGNNFDEDLGALTIWPAVNPTMRIRSLSSGGGQARPNIFSELLPTTLFRLCLCSGLINGQFRVYKR